MRSVQTDLAPEMRTVLIDWLLEVQQNFKLKLETAFLAINFLDRFLSSFTLSRRNLQLTGCAALFLASKIEEVSPPLLRNFVFVCGGAGDTDDMLRMEELISKKLDWHFIVPTSLFFCERFLRVVGFKLAPKQCSEGNFSKENLDPDFVAEDLLKARNCALFLLELALLDYRFVGVEPSRVAAAATFFALKVYSSETDTVPLYMFSGWAEDDLVDCLSGFRGILEKGRAENSVFRKYEKLLDLKELMAIGLKF
ncbi:regulation of cyclin-dependent protein serine/threonine kinase activity [Bonamia ostreae]|uniref:Regulation of cyclin-dependent protein serine/threonine kinase activity n=1 Tax=Bonamia ostreae TaxID=126728 RepID=A0ABV2AG07_9EUKA